MAKDAYILRGLPGSGKSTLAEIIAARVNDDYWEGGGSEIHTTDDYFMVDGIYQFNHKKLGVNHALNQTAFKEDCERLSKDGESILSLIICANCNMQKWEMEPYIKAAKDNGYSVHIITVGNPKDPNHQAECAARNIHGVPLEAIKRMGDKFEA